MLSYKLRYDPCCIKFILSNYFTGVVNSPTTTALTTPYFPNLLFALKGNLPLHPLAALLISPISTHLSAKSPREWKGSMNPPTPASSVAQVSRSVCLSVWALHSTVRHAQLPLLGYYTYCFSEDCQTASLWKHACALLNIQLAESLGDDDNCRLLSLTC